MLDIILLKSNKSKPFSNISNYIWPHIHMSFSTSKMTFWKRKKHTSYHYSTIYFNNRNVYILYSQPINFWFYMNNWTPLSVAPKMWYSLVLIKMDHLEKRTLYISSQERSLLGRKKERKREIPFGKNQTGPLVNL